MYREAILVAICLSSLAGCDQTQVEQPSEVSSGTAESVEEFDEDRLNPEADRWVEGTVPNDLEYSIVDSEIIPNIKRSVTIRLNRSVSEETLVAIARQLKNADHSSYDRTFMTYYLPDMQLNAGAWATTHFDPDLEVRILGLTEDQDALLRLPTEDASREVIGVWLDDGPSFASRITIFRKDDKLFMENVYGDGSSGITEIVEQPSALGRRFECFPDRGHGEYFVINSRGELLQLDADGPFMTAKPID